MVSSGPLQQLTEPAYPIFNPITDDDNTSEAAVSAWHIIQAFFTTLPQLDSGVKSKSFNLWTESYGGHCTDGSL